jgi:hypothetical protein
MLLSFPSVPAAPLPGFVAAFASSFGSVRLRVRCSSHSFSGFVCVCFFSSVAAARRFSVAAAAEFGLSFCAVRRGPFGCWGVSVPVSVRLLRVPRSLRAFRRSARPLPPASSVFPAVPVSVSVLVGSACAVGFSGSRSVVPPAASAVVPLVSGACCPVLVGCAPGVDAFFRGAFPSARVFSVVSGAFGRGRGAFAARSVAFVRALGSLGGLLVSFPAGACPAGLLPSVSSSRAFSGGGSGSWASLAFAVGSGVSCLVFLGSVPAPSGWSLSPVGGGWFSFLPVSRQLSLL